MGKFFDELKTEAEKTLVFHAVSLLNAVQTVKQEKTPVMSDEEAKEAFAAFIASLHAGREMLQGLVDISKPLEYAEWLRDHPAEREETDRMLRRMLETGNAIAADDFERVAALRDQWFQARAESSAPHAEAVAEDDIYSTAGRARRERFWASWDSGTTGKRQR